VRPRQRLEQELRLAWWQRLRVALGAVLAEARLEAGEDEDKHRHGEDGGEAVGELPFRLGIRGTLGEGVAEEFHAGVEEQVRGRYEDGELHKEAAHSDELAGMLEEEGDAEQHGGGDRQAGGR